jgi:hypothetical protein
VGRLGGPRGPPRRGPCPVCAVKQDAFSFDFLAGFKRDFRSCFRGPSGLSPTDSSGRSLYGRPGTQDGPEMTLGSSDSGEPW